MRRHLVASILKHSASRHTQQFVQALAPIYDINYPHEGNEERVYARTIEDLLDTYPEYIADVADLIGNYNRTMRQTCRWLQNAIDRNIYAIDDATLGGF